MNSAVIRITSVARRRLSGRATRYRFISATDPAIGIRWPDTVFGAVHLQSDRDRDAPTLAQVAAAGLLPDWAQTRAYIEGLGR